MPGPEGFLVFPDHKKMYCARKDRQVNTGLQFNEIRNMAEGYTGYQDNGEAQAWK